ncbi:hypothetical protein BH20ACT6_BH20ACT6_08380 [soil metagenome]
MSESVWDYPRPPRVEMSDETVELMLAGEVVARSTWTARVLETSRVVGPFKGEPGTAGW